MRASRLAGVSALIVCALAISPSLGASSPLAKQSVVRVAPAIVGPPSSIAALGDSFNTGFDAGTRRGDDPGLSWSTGDDPQVDSLYLRLLQETKAIRNHRYLVARDGSKIGDLARQMSLAADHHAQLITVQSGGNDICSARDPDHATSPTDFRAEFSQAIDVLRRRLPNARLMITSITDEGRWNDGSVQIPGNAKKLSDGTVCDPKVDGSGHQNPTRRAEIQTLERTDDAILKSVCATDPQCLYDAGAFFRLAYSATDISTLDAYHPSVAGLNLFAATAWRVGFDFLDVTPPTVAATTTVDGTSLQVALTAADPVGIAGIEYRLGPGPYALYQQPVVLAPGATITYRSVDRNRNISAAWALTAAT